MMMKAERLAKRALSPVTSPALRRSLISGRDALVGAAASARSSWRSAHPDARFLVVGAQKAGTTYLYQELVRHPRVRPALTKEIHFFDDRYHRGLRWYSGFFPNGCERSAGTITGEASPGYLFHPHALRRIAADLPDVRLVILLRDPVRRAFSHFCHEVRLGYESERTFARALALESARLDGELDRLLADEAYVSFPYRHFSYRARGEYLGQVQRAHDLFGRDRVMVIGSEQLYCDGSRVLSQVADFLAIGPWTPGRLGANDMAAKAPDLDCRIEGEMRTHYRPHNDRLFEYLGRDFGWPR